ncbi:ankyrin repeat domain-containing protein [Dyadobacter bucti]|uniref:ankyrin repeat domain-containing protein n=1 Tax=Dyadobacter bucti TaxID=2572203 RepID=UPI003F70F193
MLSQETAIKKLITNNVDFTVKEFKESISNSSKSEIFQLFIQAGIAKKIKQPDSILRFCIKNGSVEKLQTLLFTLNIELFSPELFFELIDRAAFEQYDTPGSAAALRWRTFACESLDKVNDVNFVKVKSYQLHDHWTTDEESPLRLAVFMKDPQLVQSLIEKEALVAFQFSKDSYLQGGNLLHLLSSQKTTIEAENTIASMLILAGIAIDLKDKNNHTPLALCAMNGSVEMARILINQGANIDEKIGINNDSTILIFSVIHKNYAITKLLLDHGADIHHRNNNGWTAARLAFGQHNREIGEALITKGAALRPFIGLGGSPCKTGGITVEVLDNTASGSAYDAGTEEMTFSLKQILSQSMLCQS